MEKLDDFKLIDLVKENKHLYDKKSDDYRDRAKNVSTWKDIGVALGVPGDLCRKRFRNLRDRFGKEKRHRNSEITGDASLPSLFKKMLFLNDHQLPRRHRSHSRKQTDKSSNSKQDSKKDQIEDEDRVSCGPESSEEPELSSQKKKRPRVSVEAENSSENRNAHEHPAKKSKSSTEHFADLDCSGKEDDVELINSDTTPSTAPCNDAFVAVVRDYLEQITNPVRLSLLRIQILTILHNELYSKK